jgi:hypothetical protein
LAIAFAIIWVGMLASVWINIKTSSQFASVMGFGVGWVWPLGLLYYFAVYIAALTTIMWIGLGLWSFITRRSLRGLSRGLWLIPLGVVVTMFVSGALIPRSLRPSLTISFVYGLPLLIAFLISAWPNFSK